MPETPDTKLIKDGCKTIALELMDLNPAIARLDDQETREALFEASYVLACLLYTSPSPRD